ncbi:NrfD/PsrC family molybdoenzyme membrane anchor subunit [Draconibacterium sp. IB214405]|uniref:sulfate reduction electron transfer complex DsrMKJOP subunit DsrP n=1 Tax=Draconibacterium sp. IB214405 TaxID=3097352 RepID=UPI002A163355|nr:NrfD/PsrC family molybdoenzyme membrane anchor subunit [Draconibacterium sp. IB214405]MDX8338217.1 NrfD/PsrC family molybdoenzyme membrane anchor subunit [Draconibacterium sp. IB214405]
MNFIRFINGSVKLILKGSKAYYTWLFFLIALVLWGAFGYADQLKDGLITTNMRDSVSWAFYIGNFTFLVGIAAAAIMLVIPAYIYNWKPIKEIVIFGELLAVCAVIMCIAFIVVDIGNPLRFWHMLPLLGTMNFPYSMLSWDFFFLLAYLIVNLTVVTHLLYSIFYKKPYNKKMVQIIVLISIPMAVGIHTVTAFLYNALPARPFWNSALLAPRFLASAFCSGPAILIILFQILRKITKFEIQDKAIWTIAELMVYSMFIYLFFTIAELFKEFYSGTEHLLYWKYLLFGIDDSKEIVPYSWSSITMGFIAFVLFLIPKTRKNFVTLNIGAVLIYASVYVEKGIALIIPGFTPDVLGQIYVYTPSMTEIRTAAMIFSLGFLLFTFLVKIAIAIVFENYNISDISKKETHLIREIPTT